NSMTAAPLARALRRAFPRTIAPLIIPPAASARNVGVGPRSAIGRLSFRAPCALHGAKIVAIPSPLIVGSALSQAPDLAEAGAGAHPPRGAAASRLPFNRFILGPFADPFFFGPGATLVIGGLF